jgi:D-3-phosphoglycerate dehydrogenase
MKNGKANILVTESEDFSKNAYDRLSSIGEVTLLDIKDVKELLEQTKNAVVLFVRLRFHITKKVIDNAPDLKYILSATTGLDHIDVPYFESKGGTVVSLKGEYDFLSTIPSTAEHSWGLLLALMRHSLSAFDDVKSGFWRRDLFKGNNLKGKKIGILGLGRVGIQIGAYATAFGLDIGFYDIAQKKHQNYKKFINVKELFSWADIITIHIPLNQGTVHFVNKELLGCMRENSVLVNTSRGVVIDELHVCHLIKTKKIKGYATDVLENEINFMNDVSKEQLVLLAQEGHNVIITPHIAGATYESMEMTEDFVVDKLIKYLNEK